MGKPRKSTRAKRKIPTYAELTGPKPTTKKQRLEASETGGEEPSEEQPNAPEELKAKAIACTPYPTVGYNQVPGGPILSLKDKLNFPHLTGPSGAFQPGTKGKKAEQVQPDNSTGPLTDPTVRKEIKIENLDLNVSYVEKYKPVAPSRAPKQPRWRHRGSEPLVDPKKFPAGWNSNEPDLDPNDYDAQIKRCDDRIEDNINPHFFQEKKKEFQEMKEAVEKRRQGEPQGLSRATYERLDTLKFIYKAIEKKGNDPLEEKKNVEAIINAYRTGKLEWIKGLVTYWSKGKQLCEPRPFDWDEFEVINRAHSGHKAFWVEGVGAARGSCRYDRVTVYPDPDIDYLKFYNFHVRFPGFNHYAEFEFLHDTGTTEMGIYESDLSAIMGADASHSPLMVAGYVRVGPPGALEEVFNGFVRGVFPLVEIEATLVTKQTDPTRERLRMTPWTRAWTVINPGRANKVNGEFRLDGPWLRHRLYVGSAPDGDDLLQFATSKGDLNLKRVNPRDTPGLEMSLPQGAEEAISSVQFFVAPDDPKVPLPTLRPMRQYGRPVFGDF